MTTPVDPSDDRLPTGVPGLDAILLGGLVRRGVYMVQGRPGAGKTILANQICFNHARNGGRIIYATLLAETHERLLHYIEQLSFFDIARIPEQLVYVSAFSVLQDNGLKGLSELLRREARTRGATLVVLDGLLAAEERAESQNEFKKFIQELQIHANLLGHTVLLLTSASTDAVRPEHTMVDGVIDVSDNRVGRRAERELEVRKLRGSNYLRGGHSFIINDSGVVVYPRLEALLQDPKSEDECAGERVPTGIASLDEALQGGLRCASSTVIFGPSGAGKTSLGLHFVDGASEREPALLFGFYETPERVLMKAQSLGLDLEAKLRAGHFHIQWQPATERILDALGDKLLRIVRERGIKRLFIDGIDGFLKAAVHPDRLSLFLSALTNELRVHGVTTIQTIELQELMSNVVQLPMQGVSSLVENLLLTRIVEHQGRVRRVFSIVKTRDSGYDDRVRELQLTSRGVLLGENLDLTTRAAVEAVPTKKKTPTAPSVPSRAQPAPAAKKATNKKKAAAPKKKKQGKVL